jgi:hypothetical protein
LPFALAVAFGGLLSGCSGPQEISSTEESFFAPIDSSQLAPGANRPGAVPETPAQKSARAVADSMGASLMAYAADTSQSANKEKPLESWLPTQRNVQPLSLSLARYTAQSLKDSIEMTGDIVNLLQNILEASTVDRKLYLHSHVKSWVVSNPALRDSLFYALMATDSSMQSEAGSDAEILATEDNDLIEARFGTAVFKGIALKQAIAKSADKYLYQKVIESSNYSRDIEMRDSTFVLPTAFEAGLLLNDKLLDRFSFLRTRAGSDPEAGRVDFSAYGLSFRVGPVWGGEVRMGNDELGLPFWESGKTTFLAMYKQVKVGFELPTSIGRNNSEKFVFPLRSRLLNGTRGFAGEFDFGTIGGYISSTRFVDNDVATLTDPRNFYYITDELLGYTSFGFSLTQTSWARVKVGVGYEQVREGTFARGGVDTTGAPLGNQSYELNQFDISSPYLSFEYLHEEGDEAYGCSLQYFNSSILTSIWLQIIPNYLRVEMKISKPILRSLRDWENEDFIMVSPRLLLSF